MRSRRWEEVDAALDDARDHPDGDRILAEFALSGNGPEQVWAAAALGDMRGNDGTAALQRLARVTGPGSVDMRCASLLALAKRCGGEASADLLEALADRDGTVKDYAVVGLAGAGDGRAWDQVLKRLKVLLRRPTRASYQSDVLMAVAYLVQHTTDDQRRRAALVDTLRHRWNRMNEEELKWFSEFWPDASPDGSPSADVSTPDPTRVREWARDPLFRPLPRRRSDR